MFVASLFHVLVLRLPRHFQSASVASYGIILTHQTLLLHLDLIQLCLLYLLLLRKLNLGGVQLVHLLLNELVLRPRAWGVHLGVLQLCQLCVVLQLRRLSWRWLPALCQPLLHYQTTFLPSFYGIAWIIIVWTIRYILVIGHRHSDGAQSALARNFSGCLGLSAIGAGGLLQWTVVGAVVRIVMITTWPYHIYRGL